jgi:hypothetical protein
MSKQSTLVVFHLEGTGLVSAWLKDLVVSPEAGIEYLYQGNLYQVAQSLNYLGQHSQTGGSMLFRTLSTLYPAGQTTTLFQNLKHLGRDARSAKSALIIPGQTPGVSEEPEGLIFLACRKKGDNAFNFGQDFPTTVTADSGTTEPLVVFDVNRSLNSCWLKDLPEAPSLGSQFLRGTGTFEVKRIVEVLTGNDSGQTNQLVTLLSAIYGNPSVGGMVSAMTGLFGATENGFIIPSSGITLDKPERIVYLAAQRLNSVSVLADEVAAA